MNSALSVLTRAWRGSELSRSPVHVVDPEGHIRFEDSLLVIENAKGAPLTLRLP